MSTGMFAGVDDYLCFYTFYYYKFPFTSSIIVSAQKQPGCKKKV